LFLKKWLAIVAVGIILGLTAAAHAESRDIPVSQSGDDAEEYFGVWPKYNLKSF